jgi:peptidoglycan lytic transglycosylase
MSVRVRRLSLTGLALLTLVSLLRTSISLALETAIGDANVNFRVSAATVSSAAASAQRTLSWALAGRTGAALMPLVGTSNAVRFPDGGRMLGLFVKVGRGRPVPVVTNAGTALELLQAMNVPLAPTDQILPSPDARLDPGMKLYVVRVRETVETEVQSLAFETLTHYSRDLPLGATKVITSGTTGQALRTFRIIYRNGRVARRQLLSYVLMTSPLPRVEIRGSYAALPAASQSRYGEASWYQCSGSYAAHLSLPFGTVVTVTNLDSGRTVTVVINDRGPYGIADRIIDLCSTAFAQIAPLAQGVARVKISW